MYPFASRLCVFSKLRGQPDFLTVYWAEVAQCQLNSAVVVEHAQVHHLVHTLFADYKPEVNQTAYRQSAPEVP
jgi:hypothetical protein